MKSRWSLFFVAALGLAASACSSSTPLPASAPSGSRVVVLYDEDIMLTGTTDPRDASGTCGPAVARHVVKLNAPTKARLTLRPTSGAAPLTGATLRVTHLDSKKTWCAQLKDDLALLLPAEPMPAGLYAVSVSSPSAEERRYEILWEQL